MNKPHKKLEAWKKAIALTTKIYKLTEKLPETEKFALISQMRRAAVSVASNVAEGAARNTKVDTQIIICKELGYVSDEDCESIDQEVEEESKLIAGLIKYLRK